MSNEYLKLIEEGRKKQISLTFKQMKQIRNIYKDAAKNLERKAAGAKKGSLTQGWLKDYKKNIQVTIQDIDKALKESVVGNIHETATNATETQSKLFDKINKTYDLGLSKGFRDMFSTVPNQVIAEQLNGSIYKDGKGLSQRIWWSGQKVNGDIDYIIQQGLAEKKSAYDLAKDIETYVNPDAKKEWDWKKVYPKTAKTVDYNAQRLARTSISHAYTLALLRSCERNPFVDYVKWHSVFSPKRTCQLCEERDGKVYALDKCPLDHPNGLCWQEPLVEGSLEDIGTSLKDWVNGSSNPKLDKWFQQYGAYFAGM